MNVVFLDIDGVLVTYESLARYERVRDHAAEGVNYRATRHGMFASECVAEINRITDTTEAKICVSSTWRLHADHVAVIRRAGVTGVIVGCTKRLFEPAPGGRGTRSAPRGKEIAEWLSRHPDVESFVIVDDDSDMAELLPKLVMTSMHDGLTPAKADEMIQKLQQEDDRDQ